MTQEMIDTHEKDVSMDVVGEKEEEINVNEVQEEGELAREGSVHEGDDRDNKMIKGDDEASETDSQLFSEESGKKSEDDNLAESNSDKKKKRGSKGRIFQCTGYPDCNMSFTRSEHLARHKRKHTGERPFTCPHCSKNFSRLDNLRQHKQTVHGYGFAASKKGARSNLQHLVFSHHVHSSESNSPAILGMQASDLGHTFSGIPHGSIPMTPMTHMYNQTHSTSLISPPNSNSPVNYQVYQPYGAYGSAAFNNNSNYQNPTNIGSYNNYNSHPMHQQPLKDQQLETKPKRRPKPLELSHSFIRNSDSKTPSNDNLYLRLVLKSAPAIHYDYGKILKSYSPLSAGLSPSLKSPLSPLFRLAFNQSKDIPLRSPYYAGPQKLGLVSAYSGIKVNNPLPSFQHLPIPTHFSPLTSNNDNNNKANSNDHNNSNISNCSTISYSDDGTKRQNTNTSVASEGKIDNDRYESSRALNTKENKASVFSDTRPLNSEKPVTAEKTYESRKPSISVLLSPNDDDQFPH